jgi:AP2-associated kinase
MRRGRPTAGASSHVAKPSPSPLRGDPFAALDSKSPPGPVDEISNRFPSLDQFSLLHDGGKFDFDKSSPIKSTHSRDISQRVTEKLADDAFAIPAQTKPPVATPTVKPPSTTISRAQKIISSNPELQSVASPPAIVYQPTPTRPTNSSYVSQGTMTSPTPPPAGQFLATKYAPSTANRFPITSDHHRSSSLPRNQVAPLTSTQFLQPEDKNSLPSGAIPRNASYGSQLGHARHASSSRPSLEGGRPSNDVLEPIARTKSSNSRPRPTSTYLESNMVYLREKESSGRPSLSLDKRTSYSKETAILDPGSDDETNIESNVDFLRTMEDHDAAKKDRRRSTGADKKGKRSSLPSMSLSGTKNLLAGKFGDAFKRFEHNASTPPGPRTPSPLQDLDRRDLTPIAGSEATDGRSDDGNVLEDMDNMAPEQRRELERRRLSMEEKRVANAAAEYRKRLADRGSGPAPRSIGGVSRAASIQNKVKSLLDENSQSSPVKKTAEGYGRFTDSPVEPPPRQFDQQSTNHYIKPMVPRKPIAPGPGVAHTRTIPLKNEIDYSKPRTQQPISSPAIVSKTGGSRPNAPPKPMHLNSISTGPRSNDMQSSPPKSSSLPSRPLQARPDMTTQEKEDYIADFSKRFPSLSGIEMVEREIGGPTEGVKYERGLRSKEV